MTMEVEGRASERFGTIVARAVARLDEALAHEARLTTRVIAFPGPHLTPDAGAYAPLEFLEIGIAEKMERDLPFLLVVTEVDLSSSRLAYTLALPSRLTNVVVVSTRRLDPGFWGEEPDAERAADRLAALMRHGFGHLLGLGHEADPADAMHPLGAVEALDRMGDFSSAQRERIAHALPREANERSTREGKPRFVAETLVRDAGAIGRAVARANPFRLLSRMPTMLAAALSVIVVLLFSAETWDVAYAVSVPQIALLILPQLGYCWRTGVRRSGVARRSGRGARRAVSREALHVASSNAWQGGAGRDRGGGPRRLLKGEPLPRPARRAGPDLRRWAVHRSLCRLRAAGRVPLAARARDAAAVRRGPV